MSSEPTNRKRRRHPDSPQAPPPKPLQREPEVDVRAKSSGHKKKTADKWNQ